MMLSVLANSAAFREAARAADDELWQALDAGIQYNFNSLEYFAKVRGLDWQAALKRISIDACPTGAYLLRERHSDIPVDHPHSYIVPGTYEELRRPTYKNRHQLNITENRYSAATFQEYSKPYDWPAGNAYPKDPTVTKKPCSICTKTNCHCHPLDCEEIIKPLVEIVRYGSKGNGIRVLQRIRAGDILDEYVGEILPTTCDSDDVYSLSLANEKDQLLASISSQFVGNWTRFINHSCDAACEFEYHVIGRRWRAMVVAKKDVEVFDELTIHYGSNYWVYGERLCQCGAPNCQFDTSEKLAKLAPQPMDVSS